MRTLSATSVLPKLIGLLLLAAGALKYYDVAGTSAATSTFHDVASRWGFWVCGAELALGLWLVAGLFPRATWLVLIPVFMAYLGVSLFHGLTGSASCGCFGSLEVNPWITSGLNAVLLVGLVWWQPDVLEPVHKHTGRRALAFVVSTITVGIAGALAFSHLAPASLGDEEDPGFASERILLEPRTWVGKRLPLLRYTDFSADLSRGTWIVMLHRPNCGICKQVIPLYIELARRNHSQSNGLRVALLEIPNRDDPPETTVYESRRATEFLLARLSDAKQWVGRVPQVLRVRDGIVEVATDVADLLLRYPMAAADGKGGIVRHDAEEDAGSELPDYRRLRHEQYLKEIACGPLALRVVMRELGVHLSPQQDEALLAEAKDYGVDMLRLKELAEQHGVSALGVAVTPARLRQLGLRAVVHFEGIGFAAVIGFPADGFRVVYPLQPAGLMPSELFERSFGATGGALLLARTPLSSEKLGLQSPNEEGGNGPRLRLSQGALSTGRIYRREWQATLQLMNTGNAPLRIEGIKTSVEKPLLEATLDQATLAPGQTTTLRGNGSVFWLGGFNFYVELMTNQAHQTKVKVPVRGYIDQPVGYEKPNILARDLAPGESRHWEIAMDVPSNVSLEQLRFRAPEKSPLTVAIRRDAAGRPILALDWAGGPVGWHRYFIELYQQPFEHAVMSPFHFAVEVIPNLDVFPPGAHVTDEELARPWSRRFTCKARQKVDTLGEIVWSDPKWERTLRLSTTKSGDQTWQVQVEPKPGMQANELEGEVKLVLKTAKGEQYPIVLYLGDATLRLGGPK